MVDVLSENLTIRSSVNELKKVAEFTENIGEQLGLSEDVIEDISIAVTEAVNNAIKHGNKNNESKAIEISYKNEKEKIIVYVKDNGGGFEIDKISDPRANENILKDSGRGILIMKSLMDKVVVTSDNQGTEVQLVKYINRGN
ncbi:MAG: ATP-binding protein [Candidatus Marinimicrobia bacterium]|nr:ATP-binding protein [Candidatus Neomarinimicrobiota bacterium]